MSEDADSMLLEAPASEAESLKRPAEDAPEQPAKRARTETSEALALWRDPARLVSLVELKDLPPFTPTPHDETIRKFCLYAMHASDTHAPSEEEESHPSVEVQRRRIFTHLERVFKDECRALNVRLPDLAMTRWLLRHSLHMQPPRDPLIPVTDLPDEIMTEELHKESRTSTYNVAAEKVAQVHEKLVELARRELNEDLEREKQRAKTLPGEILIRDTPNDQIELTYRSEQLPINRLHYEKLANLYSKHTTKVRDDVVNFRRRVFKLLCRYETLGGPGYQAAVPKTVWNILQSELEVKHECFASPLNCTLPSYGSAFLDTDQYFGSTGSFFHMPLSFFLEGGSFEANPPFQEEHMLLMALRIHQALQQSPNPLSFFIVVPGWNDTAAFYLLRDSPFNRLTDQRHVTLEKREHVYTDGAQHRVSYQYREYGNSSLVFFLQNEKGAAKWPVTADLVERITAAFRRPQEPQM